MRPPHTPAWVPPAPEQFRVWLQLPATLQTLANIQRCLLRVPEPDLWLDVNCGLPHGRDSLQALSEWAALAVYSRLIQRQREIRGVA